MHDTNNLMDLGFLDLKCFDICMYYGVCKAGLAYERMDKRRKVQDSEGC